MCENMSWNFQVQSKSTDSVSCDKMIYFRIDVKTKVIFVVVVGVFLVFFSRVCVTVSGYVPPQCKIDISHADRKPRAANSIPLLDRAMPSKETPSTGKEFSCPHNGSSPFLPLPGFRLPFRFIPPRTLVNGLAPQ